MTVYLEQTVSAPQKPAQRAATIAAWALIAVLIIIAIAGMTSLFTVDDAGGIKFNFIALIAVVAAAALGFFIYRIKDKIRTEYDYILTDGTLEVFGVYAEKRRKRLMRVDLREITACGPASGDACRAEAARPGVKKLDLTLNDDAEKYFITFRERDARVLALMELNDEFRAQVEKAQGGSRAIGGGY